MQPLVVGIGVLAFAVCGKRRWMCLVSLRRLIEPAPINSAFQPEDIEGHHLVYVPLEDLRMPAREIRKLRPTCSMWRMRSARSASARVVWQAFFSGSRVISASQARAKAGRGQKSPDSASGRADRPPIGGH
jgi:hypothetical protein